MRLMPILILIAAACGTARAREPIPQKIDLFESGVGGYAMYRIPALAMTPRGTLLALCEARKTGSDWGEIDILLRRSTDGGSTWSQPTVVSQIPAGAKRNPVAPKAPQSTSAITCNNPLVIATRDGAVHLLYCVEYNRCFYRRSGDDGLTFSTPVEITSTFEPFRENFAWVTIATGPGHGIELRLGRLIVPVWMSLGKGRNAHGGSCPATIYSDDGGKTWRAGEIVSDPKLIDGNETAAVELSSGHVMLNIRKPGAPNRRAVATSPTGIGEWSPIRFDDQLPEPVCMASMARLDERRILFCNPHNPDSRERKDLLLKMSEDDGLTWPIAQSLQRGPAGYSDLAVAPDGWIYCLFERGDKRPTEKLTLTRLKMTLD